MCKLVGEVLGSLLYPSRVKEGASIPFFSFFFLFFLFLVISSRATRSFNPCSFNPPVVWEGGGGRWLRAYVHY